MKKIIKTCKNTNCEEKISNDMFSKLEGLCIKHYEVKNE